MARAGTNHPWFRFYNRDARGFEEVENEQDDSCARRREHSDRIDGAGAGAGKPAAGPSPPMSQDSGKSDKAAPPSGANRLIAAQMADEWLASKFKGTDVIGLDGTKIGSVDDLLFDRSGTIKAIVVGVGGFLGIGAKDVALGFKEFQVVAGKDGNADQLKLGMTKEELTAAAEFKPYEPPRPTVSTAPGGSGMTRRSPMAPSQQ